MKSLEERDRALIEAAGAAIRRNYDGENFHHTVGAAVRCGQRRSLYRRECVLHSRRMRRTGGHRLRHHQWRAGFGSNRAVRGKDGSELLPPCGSCRQLLADYAPECEVILP